MFQERVAQFGVRIFAISVDSPETSERFRQRLGADFTFLSDENGAVLDQLNLRHHDALKRTDLAFPTGLLVDRLGVVRWIYEARYGHMRMTPAALFEAMERLSLEEQNRELLRGRAVSKVVRQVFLMQRPEDLALAIDVMQRELRRLGLAFDVCGIAIVDAEKETISTYVASPQGWHAGRDDELAINDYSFADVPDSPALVAGFQEGRVIRLRVPNCEGASCAEGAVFHALKSLVHVPFSHGTVFVGTSSPDDFSEDDVATLTEFADAITVAYQRFIDFRELALRNKKLQETQLQLIQSEKMASLGQLVAGVAHELNTPMGAISSNAQSVEAALDRMQVLLEDEQVPSEGEWRRVRALLTALADMNHVNRTASRRIIHIVDNLRRFARLDESEWKHADLSQGIEETLVLAEHKLRGRIRVEKHFEDVAPVACFPKQLNQVFMNLIVNAIQSIEGEGEIRIELFDDPANVSVRVSDTGRGIPPEDIPRIFDPGFTTKGVGVGTGLGLSICYQIVENHRGQLTVESELDRGSTFTVSIPRNATRPDVEPRLAPALASLKADD